MARQSDPPIQDQSLGHNSSHQGQRNFISSHQYTWQHPISNVAVYEHQLHLQPTLYDPAYSNYEWTSESSAPVRVSYVPTVSTQMHQPIDHQLQLHPTLYDPAHSNYEWTWEPSAPVQGRNQMNFTHSQQYAKQHVPTVYTPMHQTIDRQLQLESMSYESEAKSSAPVCYLHYLI